MRVGCGWKSVGHVLLRKALARMTARHLAKLCEETAPMSRHRASQIGKAGAESTAKALGALQRGESRYPDAPLMAALFEVLAIEMAAWVKDTTEEPRTVGGRPCTPRRPQDGTAGTG
jgi:hypothetical protein